MMRTSTVRLLPEPTGVKRCSSMTRSTLDCVRRLMSPTSSRNKRAAMGLFELARLVFQRAGEGSLDVPEQLAFDQFFRNGGAVDFHERLLGALAVIVQRVGHQFLSRAAFAIDQHAAIGGGGKLQLLAQGLHGDAVANDAVAAVQFRAQLAVLRGQLRLLQGVAKRQQGLINGKRLLNEIKGARAWWSARRFQWCRVRKS